jgi:phosphatidylglycerophosphate synthase
LWAFLWASNVAALALLILAVCGFAPLLVVGIFIYLKMMIEGIALFRVEKFFNMESIMRWFPWSFFLNILYVIGIGIIANLSPSFHWKGRHQK